MADIPTLDELYALQQRLLRLRARINQNIPDEKFNDGRRVDLNWARQMFRPGPPTSLPGYREIAQRQVEAATGLPLEEGVALLQEEFEVSQQWAQQLLPYMRMLADQKSTWQERNLILDTAYAYARACVMMPDEAIAHAESIPEEQRSEWFFGRWTFPKDLSRREDFL